MLIRGKVSIGDIYLMFSTVRALVLLEDIFSFALLTLLFAFLICCNRIHFHAVQW